MTTAAAPDLVAGLVAALLSDGGALLVGDREHMIEDDYGALERHEQAGPVLRAALGLLMQLLAMREPPPSP